MVILPGRDTFIENAKGGEIHPIHVELPFIHPQQAYESIKGPYSFLLESIKGPEKIARYSFAGKEPFLIFKVKNGIVELEARDRKILASTSPLKILKNLLTSYKIKALPDFPPFLGGAVGIISYDFVHYFEKLPRTAVDDLQLPDAHFLLIDTFIAFDHKEKKTLIISCPGISGSAFVTELRVKDHGVTYDKARENINELYLKITSNRDKHPESPGHLKKPITINHEMDKKNYIDIVKRTKEYIKAGDIFQANLSQRVSAYIGNTEQWDIYKILSSINPSPFAAYLDMGNYQIVSSSPERLLLFHGTTVETRPIAGTRPRGLDAQGDMNMRKDLLLNEKERAEHLMLIDLERNDLGKISDYGSVFVDEFMITEDYSHVIHIVSNIKGTVAKHKNCFDAVRAAFPGGTITGVPKVRCMEIIDELEPVTRGPYTGALGYISFSGNMDLNIIIRTFVIKKGIAYVQAGAGIVADSEPEKEYFETFKKAEALIKTLEVIR
ncbi:MAG: chorismate-binding protein [Thermodesulfovibrionia bacterium]|nr:chorismate-binding protein [Thermodesulfovibrionia bacterium]MCK5511751.1 chorismate-binding protein [Thermodesulfovibrionia bacterium]